MNPSFITKALIRECFPEIMEKDDEQFANRMIEIESFLSEKVEPWMESISSPAQLSAAVELWKWMNDLFQAQIKRMVKIQNVRKKNRTV